MPSSSIEIRSLTQRQSKPYEAIIIGGVCKYLNLGGVEKIHNKFNSRSCLCKVNNVDKSAKLTHADGDYM